jgi:A/G-specific adenine glycosylase
MREKTEQHHPWHKALQTTILAWYKANARSFFWRENNRNNENTIDSNLAQRPDPYIVLVSETMLQQTQTQRVQEKLPPFLEQFPSIEVLSTATNADIIKAWEGMGYNSRALRLRDCAKALMEQYSGIIPSDVQNLRALPGVGPYTASAIAAFAFHQNVAVVDVNIRRVYSRLLQPMPTTTDTLPEAAISTFASEIFPQGRSSEWHQAVMDIGATLCTARAPKCVSCPLQHLCASAGRMTEGIRTKKVEPSHEGIPNRIWRGRVVQILRGLPSEQWISRTELLHQLFSETLFPTSERETWCAELLCGLERDQIIEIQQASPQNRNRTKKAHSVVELRIRLAF